MCIHSQKIHTPPPAMPSPSSPEVVNSDPEPNSQSKPNSPSEPASTSPKTITPQQPNPPEPNPNPNPEPNNSHNAPPQQTTTNKPPSTSDQIATAFGEDLFNDLPPLTFVPKPLSMIDKPPSTSAEVVEEFGGEDLPPLTDEPKPPAMILPPSSGGDFDGDSWWKRQLATGLSVLADHANPSDDEFGVGGYLGSFSISTNLASYNSHKPYEFDCGSWSPVHRYGYNPDDLFASASSPSSKLVGAGITNMGNTCFMSAILQCFTHTVQMFLGLRYSTHDSPCDEKGFCVICAFRNHLDHALEPSRLPIIPRVLVNNLNYFSSGFVRGNQEDAHEFMQCALDKLKRGFPVGEENLIDQIFGGLLFSKLRCCSCGHSSDTIEPMIDISLEIENMSTIQQALESFTMVEKMDAKFTCSGCNQEVTKEKQLMLDKAPSVAAFHLKRFKKDGFSMELDSVKKIDSHVGFSMELDLQPYTSGNGSDNVLLKYDLYAVVEHRGFTPNSGHYFCFVRSAPDKWHLMDDDKVSSVSEEEVLTHKAYILFYAQQGTPWFSSIVENEETVPKSNFFDNQDDYDNNGEKDDNDSTDANYDNCVSDLDEECDSVMKDISP